MAWDASKYESWFDTDEGRFALEAEKRLLDAMVAPWPRRKRKLIEIGCGTGIFLDLLYHSGFDVSGLDRSSEMVMTARQRFGSRAEIGLGNAEHLPYADNQFDYAVLWSVLEFCEDPEAALIEAARVAEKGLVIGFLNKWSLYRLNRRGTGGTLDNANWFSWPAMLNLVRKCCRKVPRATGSVLPGPPSTWRTGGVWGRINRPIWPAPVGAFVAARIEFQPDKPLTGLPLWNKAPAEPAS